MDSLVPLGFTFWLGMRITNPRVSKYHVSNQLRVALFLGSVVPLQAAPLPRSPNWTMEILGNLLKSKFQWQSYKSMYINGNP